MSLYQIIKQQMNLRPCAYLFERNSGVTIKKSTQFKPTNLITIVMLLKQFKWPEAFASLIYSSVFFLSWNETLCANGIDERVDIKSKSRKIRAKSKFSLLLKISLWIQSYIESVDWLLLMAGAFCVITVWHVLMQHHCNNSFSKSISIWMF